MARKHGRPRKGELADMATYPVEHAYAPPSLDECEEFDLRIELPRPGHVLRPRFNLWVPRNKVVEFAISHSAHVDGEWKTVAKIDTDRGRVHRHVYDRHTGKDLLDHQLLEVIPVEGWDVVDRWYPKALAKLENEWGE